MTLDGSYQHHLEPSEVPGLQKDHLAGSHMPRYNLVNAPAAHIGEGRYMPPYLEGQKSPGLEEVVAAFACCAEVVGCQVHHMNIALRNDSHLMEQRCCTVLA